MTDGNSPAMELLRRFDLWMVLVLFLCVAASAHFLAIQQDRRGSDDNVWLYYTGLEVTQPEPAGRLNSELSEGLVASGYQTWLYRVEARADYARNYLVPSKIYNAAGDWHAGLIGPGPEADFPTHVLGALEIGFLVLFVGALLATTIGVGMATNRVVFTAFLISGITLGALFITPVPSSNFVLLNVDGILGKIANALSFLINPHAAFSIYGYTPRSNFIMLVMLVFGLRWVGNFAAAYWLLAGFALIHQSLAALTLALVIVLDLIESPRRFARWFVATPAIIGTATWVVRESLWEFVGFGNLIVIAFVVVGLGVALRRLHSETSNKAPDFMVSCLGVLQRLPPAQQDTLVFAIGWLISLFPIAAVNGLVSYEQSDFFWGQIHGRILAVMRPVILFAGAIWLIERLYRSTWRSALRRGLLSACLVLGTGPIYLGVVADNEATGRVLSHLRALETRLDSTAPYTKAPPLSDEVLWYYAMAREIDTGRPGLAKLFVPAEFSSRLGHARGKRVKVAGGPSVPQVESPPSHATHEAESSAAD